MATIKHKYISAKADGGDTSLVRPVNWNADHDISFNTVDLSLCTVGQFGGSFDITGLSGLTASKPVLVQQAAGPYTNKGDKEDEAEMDVIRVTGYVFDATTIRCYWDSFPMMVVGNFKFVYYPGV